MQGSIQSMLDSSLEAIIASLRCDAGSILIIDVQKKLSERILADSLAGCVDRKRYSEWLKSSFLRSCSSSEFTSLVVNRGIVGNLTTQWTENPFGAGYIHVSELFGKGTIHGFLLLIVSSLQSLSVPDDNMIDGLVNTCVHCVPIIRHLFTTAIAQRIGMLGCGNAFYTLCHTLESVAKHNNIPVLITGERGAGKELAALMIHLASSRSDGPFVPVNCAALQQELYASELFGHRKGAFTGAMEDRLGKFRAAEGGTLLLDEITEAPAPIWAGLLRALDAGEIQVLGCDRPTSVDVRILAATNRNIAQLVHEGKFPADLFDRLNILSVHVPPLRDRTEDIPLLASHFCRRFCDGLPAGRNPASCQACAGATTVPCMEPAVMRSLTRYAWPGNIRELRNVVIRMIAQTNGEQIELQHLPPGLSESAEFNTHSMSDSSLETALRKHIMNTLEAVRWNKSAAARQLALPLSTLVSKMKRLGIQRPI